MSKILHKTVAIAIGHKQKEEVKGDSVSGSKKFKGVTSH